MIIAVDFDGTCVTHEFPKVGKDVGAAKVLKELVDNGHKLILYTMRSNFNGEPSEEFPNCTSNNYLDDAVNWFNENNIPLYGIQSNPTQSKWTSSPKCYAELYIDDAALGIPLKYDNIGFSSFKPRPYVDWTKVRELLAQMNLI